MRKVLDFSRSVSVKDPSFVYLPEVSAPVVASYLLFIAFEALTPMSQKKTAEASLPALALRMPTVLESPMNRASLKYDAPTFVQGKSDPVYAGLVSSSGDVVTTGTVVTGGSVVISSVVTGSVMMTGSDEESSGMADVMPVSCVSVVTPSVVPAGTSDVISESVSVGSPGKSG